MSSANPQVTAATPHVIAPGQELIETDPDPTDEAHRYIGRITTLAGITGTGTLTSVAADKYFVLTAAHVIYDEITGQPVTQANFTPAFNNGTVPNLSAAPYGVFQFGRAQLWVHPEYRPGAKLRYDYGVMLLTDPPGEDLDSPPVMGAIAPGVDGVTVYGYSTIADGNPGGSSGSKLFDNGNGLAIYNASVGPGSSGAPVRQLGRLDTIVAVNTFGDPLMDLNMGPLLTDEAIETITAWVTAH